MALLGGWWTVTSVLILLSRPGSRSATPYGIRHEADTAVLLFPAAVGKRFLVLSASMGSGHHTVITCSFVPLARRRRGFKAERAAKPGSGAAARLAVPGWSHPRSMPRGNQNTVGPARGAG